MKSNSKNKKLSFFVQLELSDKNQFVGGFTPTSGTEASIWPFGKKNDHCQVTNNCNAGNCVAGCGGG